MRANYHSHTPRCGHAEGSGAEYVQSALDAGFDLLGISDHAPYAGHPRDYEGIRMSPALLPDYAAEFRDLKARFGDRIELHLGVEAEFYPHYFEGLLSDLRANGVEYLLLGQHFIGDGIDEPYIARPFTDRKLLDRYVGQSIDAMQTGLFTYFAHPDLVWFVGDDAVYVQEMRRICRCANEQGMPLEINLLGLREGRNYPDARFWPIAAEEGCAVVLGWDAHAPWMLNVPETERRARDMIARLGLRVQETVPLRPIG